MKESSADLNRYPFLNLVDLACQKVGGRALAASDDFFASKDNLLKAEEPIFIPGKYVDTGKWMDGWESRRKRNLRSGNDHDWCIVKLGIPGTIRGFDVHTAFFTGNFPESCAIDACVSRSVPTTKTKWNEILPLSRLKGDSHNYFAIQNDAQWTHLRLRIYPDGGVARLRVYGEVLPEVEKLKRSKRMIDLAAFVNGASVITCNDMHYGAKDNLILPGRAKTMGEGWETRRRRGPGYDWLVLRLAATGNVSKIEVDTNHFKGNYPESCSIDALSYPSRDLSAADIQSGRSLPWKEILPRTKLFAHKQHFFQNQLRTDGDSYDYIRLNIYPDGGISRFRVYGKVKR